MLQVIGSRFHLVLVLCATIAGYSALAQSLSVPRISQPIDDHLRVSLPGNVHPLAQPRNDQGPVPDSFPAQRMLLLLERSPQQQAALAQFLQDVHTPGSTSYHQWITPQQFGRAYGPADADIALVTAWLQSHGFAVAQVNRGKTAIEFSGTAAQLRAAFQTELHIYIVNGEVHHANDRDPQIPLALAPVVEGITPMNDFRLRSDTVTRGRATYNILTHQATPEWTQTTSSLELTPGDFAVRYDVNALYNAGVTGAGITIGAALKGSSVSLAPPAPAVPPSPNPSP